MKTKRSAVEKMIQVSYVLEVPAILVNSERIHNSLSRRALRTAIELHHERRIPRHFQQQAHARYGYADRSKRYISAKIRRYGTGTDLVKTGRTKREMTSTRRLSIGGQASTSSLRATLKLRFPFPGGSGRFRNRNGRQAVSVQQMAREVETISAGEMLEIQRQLEDGYAGLVEAETSARMRIKLT